MNINQMFQSKTARWVLIILGLCVVVLLSFSVGVSVGYRKATFSYKWRENYDRNFGGPSFRGAAFPPEPPFMMSAHGTVGSIVQITPSDFIVVGRDGTERMVTFSSSTTIRSNEDMLHSSDLKAGDQVLVIGAPDDEGRIGARFIRVFR